MGCLVVQNFVRDQQKQNRIKPVLLEIVHVKAKYRIRNELLRAVLNRNADVFSKHKADIGCRIFVEHVIQVEEGSVPHREGARRMTPQSRSMQERY